jgi:hypothetical protein
MRFLSTSRFTVHALIALALLSACKEQKKTATPDTATQVDRVIAATEQSIRVGAPPQMRFRGVQVYPQAMPQKMAVCGQLNPFSGDPDIFVPFVTVVTLPGDNQANYQFDHRIGLNSSEASRVYVAIVNYCYDKGGPMPGATSAPMPPPPLPDRLPDPAAKPRSNDVSVIARPPGQPPQPGASPVPASTPTSDTPDQSAATGNVTVRQNANLHADPHGPSVRVVQQGTALRVFAQAPGGWYQVGDTAPWGWIHESMLDRR